MSEGLHALGSALTNLEHLELRVRSLPAWTVLVPYLARYTRLTSLYLKGPGFIPNRNGVVLTEMRTLGWGWEIIKSSFIL